MLWSTGASHFWQIRREVGHPQFFLPLTVVEAPRSRTELSNQQGPAQHGDVLHEHSHLQLLHHRVGNAPEFVQGRNADEEDHDQPCAELSPIAEQDRKGSDQSDHA